MPTAAWSSRQNQVTRRRAFVVVQQLGQRIALMRVELLSPGDAERCQYRSHKRAVLKMPFQDVRVGVGIGQRRTGG